jgi:hypothetical protein
MYIKQGTILFNYVPQTKCGRHITFAPLFIIIIIYNSLFA